MTGCTTSPEVRMLALNYNIDTLVAAVANVGDLNSGQCHYDFIVTGGNARFTSDGGNTFNKGID